MILNFIKLKDKNQLTLKGISELAEFAIQKHYPFSKYQILIIIWLKGMWTGILISLVIHYIISF